MSDENDTNRNVTKNRGQYSHSVNAFYGAKTRKLAEFETRINCRETAFRAQPVPPACPRYGVLGPSTSWQVFPTQHQALQRAELDPSLSVFAFESSAFGGGGKRNFVVADPKFFFDVFKERPLTKRTAYEVIPEDRRSKLYFDLEFEKEFNAEKDGVSMTAVLVAVTQTLLKKNFDVESRDDEIVNLDSSTPKKFSKHVIFNLKSIAFKNNLNVGNFVRYLCEEVTRATVDASCTDLSNFSQGSLQSLFVRLKDGTKSLFIDTSVYSRNRNFRLYKATKYGKMTPLVLAEDAIAFQNSENERDIFLASLVTHILASCKTVSFRDIPPPCTKALHTTSSEKLTHGVKSKSPYEELDDFISRQVSPGYVRQWQYFEETQTMVYTIEGYRYCHNVGRQHKSNGIIIVANIAQMKWYQKCFDPDCRGFKSTEWLLPESSMPWFSCPDVSDANQNSSACELLMDGSTGEMKPWWADEYEVAMQSVQLDVNPVQKCRRLE